MVDNANRRTSTMAALATLALLLAGCATSIADLPVIGVPSDAPGRPKEVGAYPAVHDMPPDRQQSAMDPAEQARIERELMAARDRQAVVSGAPASTK
jgi:hypothetical protein